MTIEIIEEDGFLDTLRMMDGTSGGNSATTRLATVRWPDGEEADTFIKIFDINKRIKEIVNESLGFLMAKRINLRQSPRVALIKISVQDIPADPSDAFAQQHGYYYAWACRNIGGENMKKLYFKKPYDNPQPNEFSDYFDALAQWDDFANLMIFDDCVGNRDRNPGNIIFLGKNDLAIIDHGLIFGGIDWNIQGLTPNAHNFNNWLLSFFVNQHSNAPLPIAWTPLIASAQSHETNYSGYWHNLSQEILPVFKELVPHIPTVEVVVALLIQYFEQRVLSCVNRFQHLSRHFSSLGAVAP